MGPKEQQPIELGEVRKVYFDTSAWNHLSKHRERAKLAQEIKRSSTIILASVISVGEVLRTRDAELRRLMCSTISELHGDGLLLERPHDLAVAAAEALRRGEKDMLLPRTGPGETLNSYLHNPSLSQENDIGAWLSNMDSNLNRFINEAKPTKPDTTTRYCSPEIIEREDFLQLLCQVPPAKHLNLATSEMKEIVQRSDIWKALAATLAYIIELSTTHAPKSPHGRKRTGGPDVSQLVYLGAAEVFVTGDTNLLDAASRISKCLKYPRCVVSSEDFVSGISRQGESLARIRDAPTKACRVCGCSLPTRAGSHVSTVLQ